MGLALTDGALKGLDENDLLSGQETGPRIISIISQGSEVYELKLDVRENVDPNETILLEASSISTSGQPKTFSDKNELRLNLEDPNTIMTIQPYNPDNPSENLPYDISVLTNNGSSTGIIKILNPNNPKTHAFYYYSAMKAQEIERI